MRRVGNVRRTYPIDAMDKLIRGFVYEVRIIGGHSIGNNDPLSKRGINRLRPASGQDFVTRRMERFRHVSVVERACVGKGKNVAKNAVRIGGRIITRSTIIVTPEYSPGDSWVGRTIADICGTAVASKYVGHIIRHVPTPVAGCVCGITVQCWVHIWKSVLVVHGITIGGDSELLEIALARGSERLLLRSGQRWKQHCRENCDDCNDHQQLDQGESG